MIDWTKSMRQSFEFYLVDPDSLTDIKKLDCVISASITYDYDSELFSYGTIECDYIGNEIYVRIYLIAEQNNETERHVIGTLMAQSPSKTLGTTRTSTTYQCYSVLLESRDKLLPLGYSLNKSARISTNAKDILDDSLRRPCISSITDNTETLFDTFVSNPDDSPLSFVSDLLDKVDAHIEVTTYGDVLIVPNQQVNELSPVYVFKDDESSILYADLTVEKDIFAIPNRLEVYLSNAGGSMYSEAENNDQNSILSIPNRGRVIAKRETEPAITGTPTQAELDEYAKRTLHNLSELQYDITFEHGYHPDVAVGRCVLLNYGEEFKNVRAYIKAQTIDCRTGCKITSTAVITENLWEVK